MTHHVLKSSYLNKTPHKILPINEKSIIQPQSVRLAREEYRPIFVRSQTNVYLCTGCFKYHISLYLWQSIRQIVSSFSVQ